MYVILLDILIGLALYSVCLIVFIARDKKKRRSPGDIDDSDDEGGIPLSFPPDFDLPPGICLPDDPRARSVEEAEEVFA